MKDRAYADLTLFHDQTCCSVTMIDWPRPRKHAGIDAIAAEHMGSPMNHLDALLTAL